MILMRKILLQSHVNAPAAAIVASGALCPAQGLPPSFNNTTLETAYMKKLLAVLVAGLFAAGAFAQAPAAAPAPAPTPAAAPAPLAAPAAAAAPAPVAKTKATKTKKVAKKKTGKKVAKKKAAHSHKAA